MISGARPQPLWRSWRSQPHVVEKILNHRSAGATGPVGKIYQRYNYLKERRVALELWGDTLLRIVNQS